MNERYDATIVGSGAGGAAVAYKLRSGAASGFFSSRKARSAARPFHSRR